MTKEDFLIKNLGTIAKSRTSGILSAGLSCFPIAMLYSLLHYIGLKVTGYWTICSFIQLLWRKCRQLEILISLGSLELGSAQSILLLTMLKSSANKMKISSMPLFANAVLSIRDFTKRNCDCLCCVFRYVWVSKADGTFAVSEDTWNEPLGRET